MNDYIKIGVTALLSSLLTLGIFMLVNTNQGVIIERVPEGYAKLTKDIKILGNKGQVFAYEDFSDVAEEVTPAVVHITSTISGGSTRRSNDPFEDFFNRRQGPRQGSGSGVIISQDGFIVTNNHVIENASDIQVTLNDKRSFKAKLIGTDPNTDLAVLQIKADGLTTLPFGNSDAVRVGEWVLAVGNPFNLESTVTAGIVSAKGRNINILEGSAPIESFIQTDAAVNPGNSGGALVNQSGELVGINTAIATPTGTYAGYAFAVPTNLVQKVVEDIIQYGKVQRGMLGVMIRNVDGNLVKELDLNTDRSEGVYVQDVNAGSAAADAGMKKGDIIIEVDGNTVKSSPELQEAIARKRPGDAVSVTVERNGSEKTFDVVLKDSNGSTELSQAGDAGDVMNELGAEMKSLSRSELSEYDLDNGVQITDLQEGKLKRQTDIKEGFIITRVNRQSVDSPEDVTRIIEEEKEGGIMIEGTYPDYPGNYYYAFGW